MEPEVFQKLLLEEAKKQGFTESEVYYEGGKSFKVMIQQGEIAQYETSVQRGISFRGVYQGKMGYAYSEKLDQNAIMYLMQEAKQNAEVIEETEEEFLYSGESRYAQLNGFSESLKAVSVDKMLTDAKKMETSAIQAKKQIAMVEDCILGYEESTVSICNTKGLSVSYTSNLALAYISALAKKGGELKSGSEYWLGQEYTAFQAEAVGKKAAEKAVSHLGALSIDSGIYSALLTPHVMASLLATFCSIFYGENVQKGFSLFKGKLKQKAASDCVTLRDNGLLEGGAGYIPFDSEGVGTMDKAVIENGILTTFLYNLKSAAKDHTNSTGNGFKAGYKGAVQTACTNFYIENGEKSQEQLIKEMEQGLIITDVTGLHAGANPVSGDFSLSVEGFYVSDGVIQRPVEQITVGGNFYDLLLSVKAVGADLRFLLPGGNGCFGSPSILLDTIAVSGSTAEV